MTEREKIAARIRALLAKTVENGCTEDEAIAAAAKAAEMLARYNLTLDEVEMRASPFGRHSEQHDDQVGGRLWKVASAIAHMTGARYWAQRPGARPEVNFFGFEHEVAVARYLLEICARAMRQEACRLDRSYALLNASVRRRRVAPFIDGMADRLAQRIRDLKPPSPTGTGLVVLHGTLIEAAMKDAGIHTEQGRSRGSREWSSDYQAGLRAAEKVLLNAAVSGSRAGALLG